MKPQSMFGILLVLVGVAALAYQGITYKSREKTLDLGSLQVTTETTKNIPLSPALGAVALLAGIGFLTYKSGKANAP